MFYRVMKGIHQFAANLLRYIPAKYYWNRSASDLVIAKSRRVNFFWNTVYFRFGKTNVHHIGILVPFSTSSIPPQSACYCAPGCRVLSKSDHLLRKYDVISILKNGTAVAQYYFPFWSRPLRVICMSFCITLPNFVQIEAPSEEIWRHIHFSRWRLNTTSGFVSVDVTAFRRSKSISKPNFVEVSPLAAEI